MSLGRPTGRVRFRQSWSGLLVLEVEHRWGGMAAGSRAVRDNNVSWRDATWRDLAHPALDWLVRPERCREPSPSDHDAAGADFIARRAERFGSAGEAA